MALKQYIPAIKYGHTVGFDECEAAQITGGVTFVATGSLSYDAITTEVTLLASGSVAAVGTAAGGTYARVFIKNALLGYQGVQLANGTTFWIKDSAGTTLATFSCGSFTSGERHYSLWNTTGMGSNGSVSVGSVILYGEGATTNKGITFVGRTNSGAGGVVYCTISGIIKPYPA